MKYHDKGEAAVFEHARQALRWIYADPGPHGLTKVFFGDWNFEPVDVVVGDYSGDSLDDIAGRDASGVWFVSRSEGQNYDTRQWDSWGAGQTAAVSEWKDVQKGDFDGVFAAIPLPTTEEPLP